MARPLQDPQIRKNEILDAAEILFYSTGYRQTVVSDIVKKIGVSKGTFYYYFSSKEELIEALIYRHLDQFSSEMEAVTFSDLILPHRKIDLMAIIIYKVLQQKQGLLFEYLYEDQYLHLIDKFFRQGKKILAPFLLRIIEEGCLKNSFKVNEPVVAVNYILALLQGFVEAAYNKVPKGLFSVHLILFKELTEKALGVPEGTLQMSWELLMGNS